MEPTPAQMEHSSRARDVLLWSQLPEEVTTSSCSWLQSVRTPQTTRVLAPISDGDWEEVIITWDVDEARPAAVVCAHLAHTRRHESTHSPTALDPCLERTGGRLGCLGQFVLNTVTNPAFETALTAVGGDEISATYAINKDRFGISPTTEEELGIGFPTCVDFSM